MTDGQNRGENNQDPTRQGSGAPQAGDEGTDSQPTQLHPVDAPRHEHDDYDDAEANEKQADYAAEEQNPKEGSA